MIELLTPDFDYHLNPKERDQVECIVPMHQAKIHLAFRANVLFDRKSHPNCAVALSEHMVTICTRGMFGRNLKLLITFHLFDIIRCGTSDEDTVMIVLPEHEITILAPKCMRFVRNLLRNYILSAPLMPPPLRFRFKAHDPSHFPPFKPNLSPSQEFQFTYNANCSYYDTTYHHDIARYFHYLLTTGNGIFDLTQLPIHILEDALGESTDVRPITASLCFSPYIYGFTCENVTKSDLVKACASTVLMNSNLRILRVVDTGSQDGCKELARAMLENENSGIVYWDLSEHKMDISHFGQALGEYSAPVVSLKLTNCEMDGFEMTTLLTSLIENEFLYEIRQLCISGNRMTSSHAEQLGEFLRRIDGSHLEVLEIGPAQNLEVIVESLLAGGHQLQTLRLIDTPIAEQAETALVNLIQASEILGELDLSGCQMTCAVLSSILTALSQNEKLTQLKLHLNRIDPHGSMFDILRKVERKTEQVLTSLQSDEALRNKLTALSLDENAMKLEELVQLVEVSRISPNLKELSLCRNFPGNIPEIVTNLVRLIELPHLEILLVAGGDNARMEGSIMPLVTALLNNSTLKRLDISNNEIKDEGLKKVATVLRTNTTITSISIDGSKPQDLSSISEVLDVAAQNASLIDFPYPIDDIYDCVSDLSDERRSRSFDLLAHLQAAIEARLTKNRAKVGVFSRLTLLHDKVLDELIDQITLELQEKLSSVQINQHLAVAKIIGLPLPFETDIPSHSAKTEEMEDAEDGEPYVSKNFLESLSEASAASTTEEPSDSQFATLQFNSLLIRRPDSRQKLLRKTTVLGPGERANTHGGDEEEEEEEAEASPLAQYTPTTFEDEPVRASLSLGLPDLPAVPVGELRKSYSPRGPFSPRRATINIDEQLIEGTNPKRKTDPRRMSHS